MTNLSCSIIGTPFYLMRYVNGRVIKDPTLPGVESAERREIYSAMCNVLAAIHSVDVEKAELQDFGKHGMSENHGPVVYSDSILLVGRKL